MSKFSKTVAQNKRPLVWILAVMITYTLILVWGIQQNLPYLGEVDEPFFINPAVRIANRGSLNPEWFGQPGSTTIYPMAVLFHLWYAISQSGTLLHNNPELTAHFRQNISEYYYLARLVSIFYAVSTIPFIYQIGKRLFNRQTGLISMWLFLFYPLYIFHAQMARPDSATGFYIMLALWLILRVHDHSRLSHHLLAGMAIGFSIGTKYVLVALAPVYLLVCLIYIWQNRKNAQRTAEITKCAAGLIMIVVGFALSTPYFFLDFNTAMENIFLEARSEHLGADGLSKGQNLWFYLTVALPKIMTWPHILLAFGAMTLGIVRRKVPQLLLISFVCIYLIGMSISPLHWIRWMLQLVPVLVLFSAEGIRQIGLLFKEWQSKYVHFHPHILVGLVLLVSAYPIYKTVLHNIKQSNASTRVLAREWLLENVPADSKIAQEWYTAVLANTSFAVEERSDLTQDRVVANYYEEGFDYLLVSSGVYGRFYAEPERYASQIQFYNSLANEATLVQEFKPSPIRGGATIKIYHLP
ncbi:MAG: phospholipid carrier-dependent glycosyltransferase [Chloroflexi bacterium]|nr:phospholipid carrier-dependent glycosyltransferase [Chloroflexota bacterium]